MGVCFGKAKPPKASLERPAHAARRRLTIIETSPKDEEADIISPSKVPESSTSRKTKRKDSRLKSKGDTIGDAIMVCGQLSTTKQSSYEDKRVFSVGAASPQTALGGCGVSYACKKGLKPESPNQDDFSVFVDATCILLGVYDGHGSQGHEISNFVRNTLPKLLTGNESRIPKPLAVISQSFERTQQELTQYCRDPSKRISCNSSGTTATVILIQGTKIYAGHVGDSRAVLGFRKNGQVKARPLTKDHKPDLPEEKSRIEASGGEVKKLPYDIPYRVFKRGEEYPGLAMSRALGDNDAQAFGVTSVAEVKEFNMKPTDEFVIVASDGLWEFVTDEEAANEVGKNGRSGVRMSAEVLAKLAWDRWILNEEGSMVDDITVLIAYLPSKA